jgi:DNA-binding response OmpR family regulator
MAQSTPFEILLAEDNPEDAELVCMALDAHHVVCKVRVIRDGAQAITLLDSLDADPQNPALDLLLLDMNLPKCNGVDILKRLRSTEHYAQTPVIAMSGLAPGAMEEMAARQAAAVYFEKPSTLGEFMRLGSIIRSVLEKNTGCARSAGGAV